MMRLFDGMTELTIPQWITVSSSDLSVKTHTGKANGMHGQRLIGDDYYSVRQFNCSGTIITDSYPLVEQQRSQLHDMLSGKLLRVYREDTDTMFYECMLDGQISTTYYCGNSISKAFTISFTLKTLHPFGCSSRMVKTNRIYKTKQIVQNGNDIVYPNIFFCGQKYYTKPLLSANGCYLALKQPVYLRNDESLLYSECRLYINRNGTNKAIGTDRSGEEKAQKELVDISGCLTDDSITKPLYLKAGVNELHYHQNATCIVLYHDVYK